MPATGHASRSIGRARGVWRRWVTTLAEARGLPFAAAAILLAGTIASAAAEEPLSVIYGPAALDRRRRRRLSRDHLSERAGHGHRSPLSCDSTMPIPAARTTRATARAGTPRSATSCMVAGCGQPPADADQAGAKRGRRRASRGGRRRERAGRHEARRECRRRRRLADARELPARRPGDHVDGRYVFRLEATGLAGNDGNAFTATLSQRDRRDAPPPGLEVLNYAPTVRIPDQKRDHRDRLRHPGRRRPAGDPQFRRGVRARRVHEHLAHRRARGIGPGPMARGPHRTDARGARHDGGPGHGRVARRSPTT